MTLNSGIDRTAGMCYLGGNLCRRSCVRALLPRKEVLRNVRPGARVRMAARLYASGAVRSKRDACRTMGLTDAYLSMLDAAGNEITRRIQSDVEDAIRDDSVALSKVIAKLSRKALNKINFLIESDNEHVALKAATEVLDRNPETSKTFKATVSTFSLDTNDAKAMASAIVEAARVRERFLLQSAKDFVKVEDVDGTQNADVSKGDAGNHEERQTAEAASVSGSGIERQEYSGEATQGTP